MLNERRDRAVSKGVSLFTSGSDQPFVIDKYKAREWIEDYRARSGNHWKKQLQRRWRTSFFSSRAKKVVKRLPVEITFCMQKKLQKRHMCCVFCVGKHTCPALFVVRSFSFYEIHFLNVA